MFSVFIPQGWDTALSAQLRVLQLLETLSQLRSTELRLPIRQCPQKPIQNALVHTYVWRG